MQLTMIDTSTSSTTTIFVFCDTCFWCATCFDKNKLLDEKGCPQCRSNNSELTSFSIISNIFGFAHDDKDGVELSPDT
jgi:hypothetical protein